MPMFESTLLTISFDDKFFRMRTRSRRHPRSSNHVMLREELETLLSEEMGHLIDVDMGNYLECHLTRDGIMRLKFSWLGTPTYNDEFHGWHDRINLPADTLRELLQSGESTRTMLYIDRRETASFDFEHSQHIIAKIIEDKRIKRAFTKGMRDFQVHHRGLYRMYSDYVKHSFFFDCVENGRSCYNGGFILHQHKKDTPVGSLEIPVYSRHT